jgi:GNAT superfamily N-acetyltransferase
MRYTSSEKIYFPTLGTKSIPTRARSHQNMLLTIPTNSARVYEMKTASKARYRFRIRRATSRDLRYLVHHRRAMWEDMGVGTEKELDEGDRVYRGWARARMKSGELVGWVVENSEREVVGGGIVWLRPAPPKPDNKATVRPYLLSMYTERDFRRMGVASLIVKEAVKWCKQHGQPSLLLHASKKGRELYRKFGFKRTWEMKLGL